MRLSGNSDAFSLGLGRYGAILIGCFLERDRIVIGPTVQPSGIGSSRPQADYVVATNRHSPDLSYTNS